MNATCQTAPGWSAAPLAFRSSRGLIESLAALRPVARARLGARQFLKTLHGTQRQHPATGGGPGEPPDADSAPHSYLDDPVMWMLIIMH